MISVLHITETVSRKGAGLSAVIRDMAHYGKEINLAPRVVTYKDEYFEEDSVKYQGIPIYGARCIGPSTIGYSYDMPSYLKSLNGTDIVHTHGLWMLHGFYARKFTEKRGLPLVLSPHGMLEPWAIRYSAWKKKIARFLFENSNIQSASCLHAASFQEAKNIRGLGINNPIAIIPFGIDMQSYERNKAIQYVRSLFPQIQDRKILLYLSRIHQKKGLINLAEVWGQLYLENPDWHLVISGPDESNHEMEIHNLISRYKAHSRTIFTGPVYDEVKRALYAASDLFVLPTYSENFGVVIAEALAFGCPVITTVETPWEEIQLWNCGWWIELGIEPLAKAVREAMRLTNAERTAMGDKGRQLIKEKYSWDLCMEKIKDLYSWLLETDRKPKFVM
jgi:glycosyltransferase involved in cell wall biosynthesis